MNNIAFLVKVMQTAANPCNYLKPLVPLEPTRFCRKEQINRKMSQIIKLNYMFMEHWFYIALSN